MFSITSDGRYIAKEECVHHWGKLRSIRVDKIIEQKYSCCSGDSKSDGCQIGKHVYDGDEYESSEPLSGYVNTKAIAVKNPEKFNIYALDCEMVKAIKLYLKKKKAYFYLKTVLYNERT